MPRYDKYDPYDGGFRALVAAAVATEDKNTLYGVGLDSAGRVVIGAGQTGVVGAFVAHDVKRAGDAVDVMTDGEIVEIDSALPAGTKLYSDASGVVSTTNTGTYLGFTAESGRLIVRAAR